MNIFGSTNILAGKMAAPVALFESSMDEAALAALADNAWTDFPWEDRGAPRRECFFSSLGKSYTYGSGAGMRTYWPKKATDVVAELTAAAEAKLGCAFELCFANGYAGAREHLGWHADDSDEIDDGRPVSVMSLGRPGKSGSSPGVLTRAWWRRCCCLLDRCSSWPQECRTRTFTGYPSTVRNVAPGSA
jgi:hypothetical protein